MSVATFCQQSGLRVMTGLQQEIGIIPQRDYRPRGFNSARVMTLELRGINPAHLKKIQGMQNQLTMWAGLDNESGIRIGWRGTTVLIEIPKPKPYWKLVTIEGMVKSRMIRRGPVATVGLGLQDEPRRINFDEGAMAHLFITGQTRSGKTNLQRLIGWNLARNMTPDQSQIIVFDVAKSGYKWRDFSGVSNLAHPVIDNVSEAEAVLTWLVEQIKTRSESGKTTPKIFIVIDELKALIEDSEIAEKHIARIASVGGEFGLHMILATQYPQIKMLGNAEIKRNVTTRLCGRVDDGTAAHNALGIARSGAETLQGYGDFLLKDFDGLNRLTVAEIKPTHVANLERGEIKRLPIQSLSSDVIYREPPVIQARHPAHQQKPFTEQEIALALAHWGGAPIGKQKLRKLIGGGSLDRVERLRKHAGRIIYHLQQMSDECIDFRDKGLNQAP